MYCELRMKFGVNRRWLWQKFEFRCVEFGFALMIRGNLPAAGPTLAPHGNFRIM